MSTHALIATARFHGEIVQERYDAGIPVVIGHEPPLALPLPVGFTHLAEVEWGSHDLARVTDPQGRQYTLSPNETLELELGDITLDLDLVPQFNLRRTDPVSWRLSTGWVVVVLVFTLFATWYDKVKERRCELFAVTPELAITLGCVDSSQQSGGADIAAEYLERLLRKDYAGEDEGVITRERPKEGAERDPNRFFMPSGNRGPITDMGGAEEVAVEELKAPRSEALPEPEREEPKKSEELQVLELPENVGTPVPAVPAEGQETDGKGASDANSDADDGAEKPAEDKEGWGLQDWYDEKDAAVDQQEIDTTVDLAKRILRIDPNDPSALSLLSYYQYLDEDYDAAEKTYDRYIELLPDEAGGYNNKALIYKRRGDYRTEEALYRVALQLEPLDVTALNNLGVNLAHQKRFDEALAVMAQLELLDPDDAYAHLHRAKIHAEMGDDVTALRYLRLSLQGMAKLDTLHHIEFRQDIRLDPSFAKLRETKAFRDILYEFYADKTPLPE